MQPNVDSDSNTAKFFKLQGIVFCVNECLKYCAESALAVATSLSHTESGKSLDPPYVESYYILSVRPARFSRCCNPEIYSETH